MGMKIIHTSSIARGTEKMLNQANYYSFYYEWGSGLATGEQHERETALPCRTSGEGDNSKWAVPVQGHEGVKAYGGRRYVHVPHFPSATLHERSAFPK